MIAKKVRFKDGVTTSVEQALAYATRYYQEPEKIVWQDGSESWAKAWFWSVPPGGEPVDGYYHVCARIGAGAYGDVTVAEQPDPWGRK